MSISLTYPCLAAPLPKDAIINALILAMGCRLVHKSYGGSLGSKKVRNTALYSRPSCHHHWSVTGNALHPFKELPGTDPMICIIQI